MVFIGIIKRLLRKTIVIICYPILYLYTSAFLSDFAGIWRPVAIWRWFAIPDNVLRIHRDQTMEILKKAELYDKWRLSGIGVVGIFDKYFDISFCFGPNNDNHLLLFKSPEEKTWFILKYIGY